MGDEGLKDKCLLGSKKMIGKGLWALSDIATCVLFLIFENVSKTVSSDVISVLIKLNESMR